MAGPLCPTCGADLGGRSICARCGTLAGMEFGLARIQGRARHFYEGRIAPLPQRVRPHHFLWACALMPVFMLPPLVALVAAIGGMRKPGPAVTNFEWIAIIAAVNLILSGLLLYKFHFSPAEISAFLHDVLRALIATIARYLPGHVAPPQPRMLPV